MKIKASQEDNFMADSFPISYEPIKAGTYHIYMFGEIESPQQFVGALEVLRNASEMDTVVIHLQSCGGNLDATDTLLQGMRECDGSVVVRASGGCHSAATLILLQADTFTLSENFSSLIHNGSLGNGGKFSDYKSKAAFDILYFEKVMHNTYAGFLSPDEIEDVLKGVDLWLDGDEWIRRHEARNDWLRSLETQVKTSAATLAAEEIYEEIITKVEKKPRKKTVKAP